MRKYVILFSLIPSMAMAQGQAPSAAEQAMSRKILAEVSAAVACDANAIALQQKLDVANAELEKLRAKPDSK